jgi:hypothetical protein
VEFRGHALPGPGEGMAMAWVSERVAHRLNGLVCSGGDCACGEAVAMGYTGDGVYCVTWTTGSDVVRGRYPSGR